MQDSGAAPAAPPPPGPRGSRVLTITSIMLLSLATIAGVLLWRGSPVAASPVQVAINTPQAAPTGPWPTPQGQILPATPSTDLGATRGIETPTAAGRTATTASAFSAPVPAFEIAPEAGRPGTVVTAIGQGWPPGETVAVRLQDPANPTGGTVELPVAESDVDGKFQGSFVMPAAPPWSTMPAILVWAVAPRSGIMAGQPEPFVVLAGQLQPPGPPGGTAAAAGRSQQVSPSPAATGPATSTPLSATEEAPGQQLVPGEVTTPQTTVTTPDSEATPEQPGAQPGLFQSPLAGPTATPPEPRTLPPSGGAVQWSTVVRAPGAVLRAAPGLQSARVADLSPEVELAVLGQDRSGAWLLVTDGQLAPAWIPRSSTDFKLAAP